MPKDNIERAIKRGAGGEGESYEEVRYEGYGPGGVAVIVETLTDNRNRTAADMRAAFSKLGGALGETDSVGFQFDRVGEIRYAAEAADRRRACWRRRSRPARRTCSSADGGHEVVCAPEDLAAVRDALEARLGPPEEARLGWRPQASVPVGGEQAATLFKLLEPLDENDDVQRVFANFEVAEEVLAAAVRLMRLLGLDPGLQRTGWGVIEARGNAARLRGRGRGLHRRRRQSLAERLGPLYRGLPR